MTKYRWYTDENGNQTKVHIDDAIASFDGFQGYKGNAPTNEEEFNNLVAFHESGTVWKDNIAPTWEQVEAKQTELTDQANTEKANKVSAYRKMEMTDDEINAIDPTLLA
tara:strand:+ start:153 stop:479 length:327 start_codon:yes stop_codon:yes gene_type:complete